MQSLPMLMTRNYVSSSDLKRNTELESNAERLLNTDGMRKSFLDVENAGKVIQTERLVDSLQTQQQNNEYTMNRQKYQMGQVQRAHELLTNFRTTLSRVRSDSSPVVPQNFEGDIRTALELLSDVMNDSFGNERPLSGTALQTDATVDLASLSALNLGGAHTENTEYYIGGGNGDIVYVDSNSTIDRAEINGSHACFENFIRALRLAKSGDVSNAADPVFEQVSQLLEGSNQAFGEAINRAGSVIEKVRSLNDNVNQAAITAANELRETAQTDNFESFEQWQKARSNLEISRNLTAFQQQDSAKFIERILR